MVDDTLFLSRAWAELALPETLRDDLLARWHEQSRRYHATGHLRACLEALQLLEGGRLEKLALWFHDAVHSGSPGVDEAASAVVARDLLAEHLPEGEVAEVVRLVLLTAHHSPAADDVTGRKVSDSDLWVLGAPPVTYRDSVALLRAEADDLSDAQWARRRGSRLDQLLELPNIFHTVRGRALREGPARENLAAELLSLTDQNQRRPARRKARRTAAIPQGS